MRIMELAIELANTTYASRGEVQDALTTTADLAAWLSRVGGSLTTPPTDAELAHLSATDLDHAHRLRKAVRDVAGAVSAGDAAPADGVAELNSRLRAAPIWWELAGDGRLRREAHHGGSSIDAALSQTAANAVDLLVDDKIRACGAPTCVLLFVQDHPRREWCSDTCGNRVRAARHYDRVRLRRAGTAK